MQPPAAYVMPLDDMPDDAVRDATDYHQHFTERVAVVVTLSNVAAVEARDRRGQLASQQFDPIKWALFKALVHWNPNSSRENPDFITASTPGADHADRGLYYLGGSPMDSSQLHLALSYFQFVFGLDVEITSCDVWQPGAGPLEGVDIRIVDPRDRGHILAGENIDLNFVLRPERHDNTSQLFLPTVS